MKPLECADLGCASNGVGKCAVFWICLIRVGLWCQIFAAKIAIVVIFLAAVVGCCVVVVGGHGSAEAVTQAGVLLSMAFTACGMVYGAANRRAIEEVKEKAAKVEEIDHKLDTVKADAKAAAVAGKVSVQQNEKLIEASAQIATNVNGGKDKAVEEAYKRGLEEGQKGSKF